MAVSGITSVPGDVPEDNNYYTYSGGYGNDSTLGYTVPNYSFVICDATNGEPIDELVLPTSVSYTYLLNKPGNFSCSVPKYSLMPDGNQRTDYKTLYPATLALYVKRNGVVIWGGIVWTLNGSSSSPVVELTAIGWWEYFRHLRIGTVEIAAQTATQAIPVVMNAIATGSPYRNVNYSWGMRGDSGTTTDFRVKASDYSFAANALESLMNTAARFDVSMLYDDTGTNITPNFMFTIPYINNNRLNALEYLVSPSGEGVGNTSSYTLAFEGDKIANVVTGLGTDQNVYPIPSAYIADYIAEKYGTLVWPNPDVNAPTAYYSGISAPYPSIRPKSTIQQIPIYESVYRRSELISELALDAATDRHTRVMSQPPVKVKFEVVPGSLSPTFVSPGDTVRCHIDDGFFQLDEELRCSQVSVKLGEDYTEQISIDLAPSDIF